jgi:hypothetical protein
VVRGRSASQSIYSSQMALGKLLPPLCLSFFTWEMGQRRKSVERTPVRVWDT